MCVDARARARVVIPGGALRHWLLPRIWNASWRHYIHLHCWSLLPRICKGTSSPLSQHIDLLLHVSDVLPRTELLSVVVSMHADDIGAAQGDRMVYVGGLEERKNVVEVLRITQAHCGA